VTERRLPFTVTDDEGVSRTGEVVVTRTWRPELAVPSSAAFTIVSVARPVDGALAPESALVAVCSPERPVRLPAAAAEPAATYSVAPSGPSLRLPGSALDAYARGVLLAAAPLAITPREVFADRRPRLEALARAVLAAGRRSETCWLELDTVLSWPEAPPPLPRPAIVRRRLRELLARAPAIDAGEPGAGALERLSQVAEGAEPRDVAPQPAALAEDVALARCLLEQPAGVQELTAMRAYVDGMRTSAGSDLDTDGIVLREQLSFVTLLEEPQRIDGLRATFELFRNEYVTTYVKHHEAHRRACARLAAGLEEAAPIARALMQLNTLSRLGRASGRLHLRAYEGLAAELAACPVADPAAALRAQPRCPSCGLSLEDEPPTQRAQEVVRGLRDALARRQSRLAGEAIRRILARGGERIEQFLRVVQAADLTGLARVLDDELLAFLQDLLDQPAAITPDALELARELAAEHPIVRAPDIDAAVESMRRLLRERVDAADGALRLAEHDR
jgi:hypothetical protein